MSDSTACVSSISATFAHSEVQRVIAAAPALQAATAAVQAASDLGVSVNIALVDASGVLAAFVRMPGAPLHSIDIAIDKAYTSAGFGFATAQWAGILQGDEALRLGMPVRPRNVVFGGGLPLREGGVLIGGIGVSGGSAEEDEICARAALTALGLDNA